MKVHEILTEGVAGPKKCWPGHRKTGTQPGTGKNKGKRVNDCEKIKEQGVAEGVPQPGPSSGAPKKFGPDAKIETGRMTVKQIISSIPGVPYYNNVVDDWDAKDYSWGVTKKVIEYATYLKDHPESLEKLPPILVLNGKFEDGAHRVSAIWLLQQRMDPKNPLWANAKLNVQFVKQGVAEDESNDTAISLSKLGKFHPGTDTLAEFVPERATAQYALHPDKWESTFYSLTNKDSDKLKYYGPKKISIPPGTLVGDMAIANKFYRAKTPEEQEQYAELYKASLQPYPVDVSQYRMPELLIPKQGVAEAETDTQNSKQLAKEFRQLGYSQIGSGADATVWAKDSSYVIKILMPEDAGSRSEQIFRKFYEFSMAHQDLACVPRFNEVNTIDINGKDYTQIEMERLAPIETGTFMEGVVWLLSDYVMEQTPWPTIESELAMPSTWEIYSPNYANALARTWKSFLENPAGRKTYAMYRQLYNVMKLLFTTGTINKFGWDLHTANVMRRNNGQPVIIDPWFSSGTS